MPPVLRRIALDLRLAMLAALDLVAEVLLTAGKLGWLDSGCELLRPEQAASIQGPGLSAVPLGDVEDDGMGVELRRGVAGDGPGSRARRSRQQPGSLPKPKGGVRSRARTVTH